MNVLMKMQNRKAAIAAEMRLLCDKAELRGDEKINENDARRLSALEVELLGTSERIKQLTEAQEQERNMETIPDVNALTDAEYFAQNGHHGEAPKRVAGEYVDKDGKPIQLLSHGQPIPRRSGAKRLHLGGAIVGQITGKWDGFEAERLAMYEGSNIAGGYLVKDEFSNERIDLARAASVTQRAGARTVTMNSETLHMAKVTSDPTFQMKAENAAFDESGITFGGVTFTAKTIGTVARMSRELMMDAPNAADILQNSLATALALELDRQGLLGTGSEELTGLLNAEDVGETDSIGAIEWNDLAAAALEIRMVNGQPNAYVCSPTIENDLLMQTSGDGTNSAKLWLPAPPVLDGIARYATTACPDANLFMGDWSQLVFGVRQTAELRLSEEADDAFHKNQVLIRIIWRGDLKVLRPTFFHRLIGITT